MTRRPLVAFSNRSIPVKDGKVHNDIVGYYGVATHISAPWATATGIDVMSNTLHVRTDFYDALVGVGLGSLFAFTVAPADFALSATAGLLLFVFLATWLFDIADFPTSPPSPSPED